MNSPPLLAGSGLGDERFEPVRQLADDLGAGGQRAEDRTQVGAARGGGVLGGEDAGDALCGVGEQLGQLGAGQRGAVGGHRRAFREAVGVLVLARRSVRPAPEG